MYCKKCGEEMFETEFHDFSVEPYRTYQGEKCLNLECELAHVVIEKAAVKRKDAKKEG